MSTAEATELTDVLNRVNPWPPTLRITLERKVLESLDKAEAPEREKTTGLSAKETSEPDHYLHVEHLMRLARVRARTHLTP